ncbi:MAG: E3 binding domain-containing protein [Candidatus Spechtbacterales bacterium]
MKSEFGFYQIPSSKYDPAPPDCRIQRWLKGIGDIVEKGEPLLVFEADKVGEVELESPFSGTIVSVKERYRDGADDEGRLWVWNKKNKEFKSPALVLHLPELGYIETGEVFDELPAKEAPDPLEPPEQDQEGDDSKRVRAAPAARKMARDADVDIEKIPGTGLSGRVMLADVKQAIAQRDTQPVAKEVSLLPKHVVLLTPAREWIVIADNLKKGSGTTIAAGEPLPPDWREKENEEYDLSSLIKFREQYGVKFQEKFGVRLRLWAPVALALTRVLASEDFAIFNGFWHSEDEEDRTKDRVALYTKVNLGMSYDRGEKAKIDWEKKTISGQRLRILTLHDAQGLGLGEFFSQVDDLFNRADHDTSTRKMSKTTLRDWTGWTFIFNNVGAARHKRGVSLFTPRMSAMLNMGTIRRDGRVTFQIFFDHRLIDGVPSTDFVDAVYEELNGRVLHQLTLICLEN